jgi:hypothetical protein
VVIGGGRPAGTDELVVVDSAVVEEVPAVDVVAAPSVVGVAVDVVAVVRVVVASSGSAANTSVSSRTDVPVEPFCARRVDSVSAPSWASASATPTIAPTTARTRKMVRAAVLMGSL